MSKTDFDTLWGDFETAMNADIDSGGCEHTPDGGPMVCWSCREKHARQTFGAGIASLRDEVERLNAAYDALTGEKFSERVHVALRDRADKAERERDEARKQLDAALTVLAKAERLLDCCDTNPRWVGRPCTQERCPACLVCDEIEPLLKARKR